MSRRDEALGFERIADRRIKLFRRNPFQLIATEKMRLGDLRAQSLPHFDLDCYRRVHFDRRARDLPIALRVMDVANRKQAAINKARQQQRRPDLHLLDVHIAAILARRNGSQTAVAMAAQWSANLAWQRVQGLRGQYETAGGDQFRFAIKIGLDLCRTRRNADRTHEAGKAYFDPGNVGRCGVMRSQVPTGDEGVGKHIAQETKAGDDNGIAEFIRLDIEQSHGQYIAAFGAIDVKRPR